MLVSNESALKRLNSSGNLINRLKKESSPRKNAMSLFIRPQASPEKEKKTFNPFTTPAATAVITDIQEPQELVKTETEDIKLDDILKNNESQIRLGIAHDKALDLLNRSVEMLSTKLDDVKADKLPAVISAASKTVESIRRERLEQSKQGKDKEVHYHFYTPTQKPISDYDIIDVGSPVPSGA